MNLINLSVSNNHEDTEHVAQYYNLMRNELFDLEKQRLVNLLNGYHVRKIIL